MPISDVERSLIGRARLNLVAALPRSGSSWFVTRLAQLPCHATRGEDGFTDWIASRQALRARLRHARHWGNATATADCLDEYFARATRARPHGRHVGRAHGVAPASLGTPRAARARRQGVGAAPRQRDDAAARRRGRGLPARARARASCCCAPRRARGSREGGERGARARRTGTGLRAVGDEAALVSVRAAPRARRGAPDELECMHCTSARAATPRAPTCTAGGPKLDPAATVRAASSCGGARRRRPARRAPRRRRRRRRRARAGRRRAALVGRVFDGRGLSRCCTSRRADALRAHEHLWARAGGCRPLGGGRVGHARRHARKWAGAAGGMRGAIANYEPDEYMLEGAGLQRRSSARHVHGAAVGGVPAAAKPRFHARDTRPARCAVHAAPHVAGA